MVVYTKRGDGGETSLGNGLRVAKDDVRIETNGELDELTSLLGIVTEYVAHDAVLQQQLMDVQQLLMQLMAHVADDTRRVDNAAFEAKVREMERYIDANSPRHAFCFVRPGGNLLTAHLHYARAKARTCEPPVEFAAHAAYPFILLAIHQSAERLFVCCRFASPTKAIDDMHEVIQII